MSEPTTTVLSPEKHYFGFSMDPLAEVLTHYRCEARRCGQPARWLLRYAYVRQRDRQPTYVVEAACEDHASVFAADWGLS